MIGIGISTYNDYVSTKNLIESIKQYTPGEQGKDYKLVVVDDGTRNESIVSSLSNACQQYNVLLVRNPGNRGIPYTWNRIVESCNTDIVIIFNNDILLTSSNWLRYIEYFLTQNDKIGTVGFPLINYDNINSVDVGDIKPDTPQSRMWGDKPGHVGAAIGCCFGFKTDVWRQIKNIDGSTGFWEDLVSFHEETHFGFKLSEMGYYNYMLNWPPMLHVGGKTFRENPELIERPVDWSKWNKEEYINVIMKSNIYPQEWKRNNRIAWTNPQGVEVVDRMAFSRYMFAKYWNVLDEYDNPQIPVHRRIIDPMPKRTIKWLDHNMNERIDTA